jgi:hypothetical protein
MLCSEHSGSLPALRGSASCLLSSTAYSAGPPTFFASPKKVGKERRPREAGLRYRSGFPCAAGHQRAVRETRSLRSLRHAPGTAPLLPRTAAASPSGFTPSRCRHGDALGGLPSKPPSSAGRAGAVGHRLSEARGSARSAEIVQVSMATGPFEQRRAPRRGGFVGAAFFGYFLCQDKESNGPRGPEAHLGSQDAQAARRAKKKCAAC